MLCKTVNECQYVELLSTLFGTFIKESSCNKPPCPCVAQFCGGGSSARQSTTYEYYQVDGKMTGNKFGTGASGD